MEEVGGHHFSGNLRSLSSAMTIVHLSTEESFLRVLIDGVFVFHGTSKTDVLTNACTNPRLVSHGEIISLIRHTFKRNKTARMFFGKGHDMWSTTLPRDVARQEKV
jgi:hypothetical protein